MKKPAPPTPPALPRLPHNPEPGQPTDADELAPPFVSDQVIPLPGAARGLGISSTRPWMTLHLQRWTKLEVGDSYKFYMGSDHFAIASDQVRDEDLDKHLLQLVIFPELIPENFIYPCFVEVTRRGTDIPSTSPRETWYVKTTRPGGVSKDPALSYHTELVIHLPPDLVGNDLDPERAKENVELTIDPYPNITVGDTAEVHWNGHPTKLRIDDEHVAGIKPITVVIPESTIYLGGSGEVIIRFRLYDKVFNYSGELQQWSQAVTVVSNLDRKLLPAAHFVVGGYSVIDVNLDIHSSGFFLEMVVPRRLPDGTLTPAGALIVVTLSGADAAGASFERTLAPFPARIELSSTVPIDLKDLEAVLNGHMQFEYTLTTAGGVFLARSQRRNITVHGTKSTMPAMTIEQNEGGNIDPEHPYIKVIFPRYTPYDRNYNVTLRMEAVRSGGGLVFYEETLLAGAEPPPERYRIVLQEKFERFVGLGPVRVFYLVDNGTTQVMNPAIQAIRKSEVLEVIFGLRYADLPAPQMQYVDEFNNLDPARIKGGLVQATLPYTRTIPGDVFKWTLLGATSNGSASDEISLNSATAGKPVLFNLDEALIVASRNGEIRFSYSLVPASGGATRYSEVLTVTVGEALDLLRPEVLQAQRYPDQLVPEAALHGATIAVTYPQMLSSHRVLACWTGIPEIGTHCETKDGNTSKTVHFEVPPEVIGANLNGYGRYIEVQYFVLLGVHQKPSPVLSLYLLAPVLPLPYLEGHTTSVLDISRLIGTERAMVERWSFISRYQRMWFELSGTYANDTPFYAVLFDGDLVTYTGEQNGIQSPAPVLELRQLKDGSQFLMRFGATFDQTNNKSNALWFPERRYTVQAVPAQFPLPELMGATGSGSSVTLLPLVAQYGAKVNATYSPMYTSDRLTLEVVGAPGAGSGLIGPKDGETDGTVTFDLPAALIAANIGNHDTTFTLKYTVWRNGELRSSAVLTVTLKAIPAAELNKTVIRIDEAANGVLNVDELIGDATARLGTWPFIARNQPVWLRLIGNKPDGTAHNLTLLDGTQGARVSDGWLNQGYQLLTVLNTYLRDLGNGTRLTMQFKVALNHSTDEWQALEFPVVTYSILSLLISDKTPFTGGFMNGWISQYPEQKSIQREADGNYYLRHGPMTGDGVRIYKIYTPVDYGYYRVRFKYRVNKFASIGGPTSMYIHLANLTRNITVTNLNTWNYVDEYMGYWKGGNFQASIAVMNPTTGGVYDIDDVWIQQRHFPG